MFCVGQTVLYGANGVCTIEAVTEKRIGTTAREYYVLKPVNAASSTLFVPTANEQLVGRIRLVLTPEEIDRLLRDLPPCDGWIDDKQARSERFREVVSGGDCGMLIGMIRLLHAHQREQAAKGKRLHLSDERFLKEAEGLLCDELSFVLHIDRDEVLARILR